MKENNLNRVIGWSGLLLTSLLSTSALADNIGTSAEELGLSDYRHFVIYPRLDKALKAQKNNDEATAIREFEYIHQQVPDNIPLTLYLAEAYRHFGHDDRARLLLEDQLKRHPGDDRLERSLAAIPVEVKSVTTVEELLAQQKACDAAPTLRCRSEVGQNALRLAQLPVARAQLNDATFAASPEGKTLRTDLLQRAIYLKQWSQADTLYNEARQQNTLSAAERRQWFDVLLAAQLDDRILALQSQGIFTDPQSYITYATALAYRGEKARLQHYLIENKPLFTTDAQEKSWLYLLSKYSANPVQALANYTVQFADNRQYVVGATLPVLLKEGQYDAAQKLLATLPANEMLEERYAVSVATRNKAEALRLARLLYQQEPASLTRLDQLTWQLMQNGQSREAADLLLQRYPFQGDARVSQTLMARLASLLESHPYLATPAKVAILSKPLPLAEQRQWQSQLPGIADNCPAIVRLLGDMSPSYDAAAWNRLAKCYRDTLPGVALYAWLQAEQRQPDAWQHRAVAYQAYQVEDYATALTAWQKISLHDMSNEDLLAAANTAQAAGNGAARDRWLQQAEQRGLGNNALYWWLHAQRYIPGQPELALNDLTRSINIAPSANAYVARATIYRQRHNIPAAVSDLRAALELEPNNSNTQAALGYALWDSGDIAQSREMLEQAHKGLPDDPALIRQLAYVNQRLDDMPATQHYARLVIDDIDNQALITPLTPEQNQQRFNFRRLHEEVGRRWSFSFDSSIGLRSGAMSTANNNVGGAAPGKSYRSYGQLEAEYRLGRNMLLEGDLLSVYSRVFADTGENGVMMPVKNPMSGTGLRWKPLRDQIFFLAVEQQLPLNGQNGASDTMLRASASFFNGGKYSDEWHPNGSGWFAQNLYLDAAQYIRQDIQAWTADYRVSWHQKVANGQTIEPYAHVQDNGYRDKGTQGAQLGGVGVRWNIWTGETHYDAWPHKVSQLDWKFNNAAIIKGAINWDLMPQISIGAAGWTTLGSRGGNMVDQDWMDSSNPGTWTDESRHPDTQLNYANEFDLNIKGWLLNEPNYRLGLMAGYQESRYSFTARGGSYIYSSEEGFRDDIGSFPNGERAIGYKQRFKMPYIGLTGSYRYEDFELGGTFKYSGWVEASDNDEHYDPGKRITYRSKVKDQNYYSVAVNAGYYVTPNAKVYIEGAWNRVTNKKGNTSLYDHNDNTSDYSKNGAGIENYNFITTAGLKYTF
ncbi:TPA: phage receptor [Escherichia coli H061]|nr:phage receptor [Escherichia coli H061]